MLAGLRHQRWACPAVSCKSGVRWWAVSGPVSFRRRKNRVSSGTAKEGGLRRTPVVESKQTKVARPSLRPPPHLRPPQQARFPAPSPLSKPTRTARTDAEAPGAGERGRTRSSSRRPHSLVTPVTPPPSPQSSPALGSTAPPRAPPPAGGFAVPNSVPLGCGRPRTSREGGERRGRGGSGRGGGWKARESALRAAPLPRACQQRALGGSGPNRARRLASSASAPSRLWGSPGLSEVPTRPGFPLRRPASAPQLARSTARGKVASKRASAPSPQPRAPAPRGDEGPGR